MNRLLTLAACLLLLGGCASTTDAPLAKTSMKPSAAAPIRSAAAFKADRRAILGMLGEYQVTFAFDETVELAPNYVRRPPLRSGGFETVVLIKDSGERIVLQHLLVSEDGHVTKHWRQDWTYQASTRFEYSADQTWTLENIPDARTRDAWTQCVYEVSDAPRYCGTGVWTHKYGVATWTSDRTWRPLPRREYTERADYNALNVENRHTVTPNGWTHEQDNTKVRRGADGGGETLVREFGFNEYRRINSPGEKNFDFSPAYREWKATAAYWARVRAEWRRRMASGQGVHLKTGVAGMPIIVATFTQAAHVAQGEPVTSREIDAVFDRWVEPVLAPGS